MQRALRVALVPLGGAVVALVLAACGGSDGGASYAPAEVESAFREAGLPLQRLSSVGAEQPAMGETSSCGTHYLVRSSTGEMVSVLVCEDMADAELISSDPSMSRANVAVQYAGYDTQIHERIDRALDGLDG